MDSRESTESHEIEEEIMPKNLACELSIDYVIPFNNKILGLTVLF
jgi:hypothetical protein